MEGINAEERQSKRMHMVPGAAPCSGPGCPDANQMDMPAARGKGRRIRTRADIGLNHGYGPRHRQLDGIARPSRKVAARMFVRTDLLIIGVACVVIGIAWVISCTSTAAGYRAAAAACSGGQCSQTAGSSYIFMAAVFDVVTWGGVALILVGICLSLAGAIGRREDRPRDTL